MKQIKHVLCSALFIACYITTYAQAGTLDETFGTGGITNTLIAGYISSGNSIACSAGKIFVGGRMYINSTTTYPFVAKYNSDGTLDETFGSYGAAYTVFSADSSVFISKILIQDDGKIVGAGFIGPGVLFSIWRSNVFLIRYNADGTLDNTFGTGGYVNINISDGEQGDAVNDMAFDSEGRIVICGTVNVNNYPDVHYDYGVARFTSNGSIDETFGDGGKVITDVGGVTDVAGGIVTQPDNKIVVAGYYVIPATNDYEYVFYRYNADGSLDNTFGTGGKFITGFGSSFDVGSDVVRLGDGSFIGAGSATQGSETGFGLVKLTSSGALDASFGAGGKFFHAVDGAITIGGTLAVQPDGKILVGGAASPGATSYDYALMRVNTNGTLDTDFGTGGDIVTDFEGGDDRCASIALDDDLKIVASGSATIGAFVAIGLAKYNSGLDPDGITTLHESIPVEVFPNPSSSEILFTLHEQLTNAWLSVITMEGKEVLHTYIVGNTALVEKGNLPAGIYVYQITSNNTIYSTGKIVLQ